MLIGQPGKIERWLTHTISGAIFVALSFALLVGSLTRLASLGPAGAAHPNNPIMYGGAVGFSVGHPPTVNSRSAYVFDADLGFAYFNYHANDELPMASCTKIMTALLAVEHGSLDQVITVGADAHALVRADTSYMGLGTGETLPLRDLLYGLVLPSGNDAAISIADGISGNVTDFVALMNRHAQQLGLTHTHFMNPHGLGAPNHYTSARDLAVLAGGALKKPLLGKVTPTRHYNRPKTPPQPPHQLES